MPVPSRALAALAAVTALAGVAAPAAATVYTATYTGKIGFGFDTTGYFGTPGSLNEVDYVMVYTIDDAAPGAVLATSATGSGISGSGAASPVRMAITINGVTRKIDGSAGGSASVDDRVHASGQGYFGYFDRTDHAASESNVSANYYHVYTAQTYIASYVQDFITSPDFRAPLVYSGTTGSDSLFNLVQFNDYDFTTATQVNYTYLNMRIGDYRFDIVAPGGAGGVPEPASWALLVAGFGVAGAAQRRRRAVAA